MLVRGERVNCVEMGAIGKSFFLSLEPPFGTVAPTIRFMGAVNTG